MTNKSSTIIMHNKMIHLKIKDIECQKCYYKCSKNSSLKMHVKNIHDKIKDIKCDICDYACSDNGNLYRHIKQVHLKLRDNLCPDCNFKCSDISDLKRHLKTCTGLSNMSKMEQLISQLLDELNITYFYDENFMNLKSAKGGRLRLISGFQLFQKAIYLLSMMGFIILNQ
jgi:hypothetical protein